MPFTADAAPTAPPAPGGFTPDATPPPQAATGFTPDPPPSAPVKPKPQVDPTIMAAVQAAVKAHPGVRPELLLAIGEQETGLGASSVYDPVTGTSRTPGNKGRGIWQLDPASGASPQDLERAAHDPFFAADRAAAMIEQNLRVYNGDVTKAVASYNAGSPTPVGLNYAQQVLANVEKWNPFRPHGPIDGAVRTAATWAHQAAENTIGALDAVLGAPQRFVEGTILDKPGEWRGAYLATHPRDEAAQQAALHELMQAFHLPEIKGNDWLAKLERFSLEFATQTGTDPLTVVPLLGEVKMVARGRKIADAVTEGAKSAGFTFPHFAALDRVATTVARSSTAEGVRKLDQARQELFGIRPELDKYLTSSLPTETAGGMGGKQARLGIEQAHRSTEAAQGAIDARLLREHADALKNAESYDDLPTPIKVRQLIEPWLHGTPEMRTQAETLARGIGVPDLAKAAAEMGVVDPAELARYAKAPSGLLHYDLREDYLTLLDGGGKKKFGDLDILRSAGGKHKEEFAGFEKRRRAEGEPIPVDIAERVEARLRMGRARIRQEATDRETEAYLREHPEAMQDPKADPAAVVDQLSHAPKKFAPDSPLRGVGRAYKFAISMNPFPHFFKNVGTLAYLWGGPEAFGRGIGHAATGLSDEARQRLVTMGADPGYVHDIESTLENAPLAAVRAAGRLSEHIGNRLELGYRQALLDQLDRRLGSSVRADGSVDRALELQKSAIIREALGDYRNAALFTSVLEALGGPFAIFRTSIVPRAVSRAIKRRPRYVEDFARGQQDINAPDGPMGHQRSEFELGGPVEDFSRMGLPSFYTSPATIGPASYALWAADPSQHKTLGGVADRAMQFIPYGSSLESLGALQPLFGGYGAAPGVSPAASVLSSVLGSYFRFRPAPGAEIKWERGERRAP